MMYRRCARCWDVWEPWSLALLALLRLESSSSCKPASFFSRYSRTMNAVLTGSQLGGRTMNMLCTAGETKVFGSFRLKSLEHFGAWVHSCKRLRNVAWKCLVLMNFQCTLTQNCFPRFLNSKKSKKNLVAQDAMVMDQVSNLHKSNLFQSVVVGLVVGRWAVMFSRCVAPPI